MPNEIRHKTSTTLGAVPTAAQLAQGELAINAASGQVYTKKTDNTVVDLTNLVLLDGGEQLTPLDIADAALWFDGAAPATQYQTQAGGAVAVAAPTDIAGCFAWWDAADASTLTVTPVTNRISQWNDKISGRNFTASTTTTQPLLEANTLNGRNVVRLEVATNMSVANDKTSWNFLHQPTGGGWLFMVLQPFNTFSSEQWGRVFGNSNYASANVGFDFFIDDRLSNGQQSGSARLGIQRGVSGTSSATAIVAHSFSNDTGAYVVAIKYDPGNATAAERLRLFVNGVGGANITSVTDAASATNASGDLTLGFGASITGFVAEILIYNTLLSETNRARIEKYLAVKWGISAVTNTIAQDTAPITTPLAVTNNTCALWLDGADASTMYNATSGGSLVTDNSAVLRWEDKSGNGRHATQSVSSSAPTRLLSSLNNRAVLNFSATKQMSAGTVSDWNFLHNAEGGSVFIVVKPSAVVDPQDYAFLLQTQQNTSTQVGFGLFYDDRTPGFSRNNYLSCFVFLGVSGQSVLNTDQNNFFSAANSHALVSVVLDPGRGSPLSGRAALYREGARLGSNNTQSNSPATSNSAIPLQIGNIGANAPAEIAEIIVFRRPMSDADRARVENYLAAKWGFSVTSSALPIGSWQDRSGNNRHATQATAANRPTTGTLNSRAAISFAGANSVTTPEYPARAISTYFYVSRHTDTAETLFQTGAINAFHSHLIESTHKFRRVEATNQGLVLGTNLGVGLPSLWCVDYSNNLISARYNGVTIAQVGSISAGAITDSSRATTIGRLGPTETYAPLNGDVAEFLVYGGRHLSTAEKRVVESYLAAKWGITLAPAVSNLNAQDWINRVYLNGGTVTSSTAAAVDNFCNAIDAAGIRDRFYRLNLFCGDNLTACLVPLYRGPSLGGTQFGNTTDTNVNFAATDYSETGVRGGLVGDGSSKYLNTGFNVDQLPGAANCHLSSYIRGTQNIASVRALIGVLFNGITDRYRITLRTEGSSAGNYSAYTELGKSVGIFAAQRPNANGGLLVSSRTSTTSLTLYDDGVSIGTASDSMAETTGAFPFLVFARTGPVEYYNGIMAGYSIGAGMSQSQVTSYYNAMNDLQTALGRAQA